MNIHTRKCKKTQIERNHHCCIYHIKKMEKDKKEIQKLSSDKGIEKYGREKYHMKKENEEIYLIEYEDSLKDKKNE